MPPTPQPKHPQTVDHGGVRVRTDQGVGIGSFLPAGAVREDHPRQALDIDLVHDAGVRRHNLEITECRLPPAQKHVALAVALEFDFVVVLQRIGRAVFVDLHRMIDDQFGRRQRIDFLRIAAELHDGFAHGRQIDDARHAGEILHDDPRRREGDLMAGRRLRIPLEQRLDVALGDVDAVFEAQQILQQDLQGKGQAVDVLRLQCSETQNVVLLRAHFERRSRLEAVRHDPSAEK